MTTELRILVALDGSEAAEAALPHAGRIAAGGAEVHFLHVVPSLPSTLGASSAGVMQMHDQALAYLESLRQRLPGLRGLDLIRTGTPADAIFQVARDLNIDLIAMGAHDRTGLSKEFVGSVAETVVRQTQLPVLLMRPGIPDTGKALRRILVPLDGSEESFTIMATVKLLALRTGAEVLPLHVAERALASVPRGGGPGESGDLEEKLQAVAERLDAPGLVFRHASAVGNAVDEILGHAKALDADVIAMSTHALSGQERAIGRSVVQDVLWRSDRAVLLQEPVVQAIATGVRSFR